MDDLASYKFRKDRRTDEEFDATMEIEHLIHSKWAEVLSLDFSDRCRQYIGYENLGVDNSGAVIKEKTDFSAPDYKFLFPDKVRIIEIKTIPTGLKAFYTFKAACVRKAVSLQSLIIVPNLEGYDILNHKVCEWMLANLKIRIYDAFSPNDPAVRISQSSFDRSFYKLQTPFYDPEEHKECYLTIADFIERKQVTRRTWTKTALNIVNENRQLLF